jgi:hypothetical protein
LISAQARGVFDGQDNKFLARVIDHVKYEIAIFAHHELANAFDRLPTAEIRKLREQPA